jgi:hypothetical protein
MNDDDRQEGIFDAPAKHAEQPAKECGCGYPPHVGRCQPNTGDEPGESTITSLAVIETTSAALVYAPGALTALVDRLKQEVRAQLATLDVSIPKDKARIISLSARVATAKERLDEMGATLTEEHRAVVNAVNADRKIMRDDLAAFKVEVRKPVTDWENAEKSRVAEHEDVIRQIEVLGRLDCPLNLEEIEARAGRISVLSDRNWQEFKQRAAGAKAMSMESLSEAQNRAVEAKRLREQAERLEVEARERAIKEREEAAAKAATAEAERKATEQARLAREAAEAEQRRIENERIEAEARAKQAEAQRIAAEERAARELREAKIHAEAIRRAEADAYQAKLAKERREAEEAEERAQQALRDAEARRIREAEEAKARGKEQAEAAERRIREVEAQRIAAAKAAELAASAAAAKAKREQEAAIEAERQRVAAEKRKEAAEAEARAKNRAHLRAIHHEILAALALLNISEEAGNLLIAAIAKGAVPHVTISY